MLDESPERLSFPGKLQRSNRRLSSVAIYIGIPATIFLNWFVSLRFTTADTVSYLDISDAVLKGRWYSVVNGYWSTRYPVLLAIVRLPFGTQATYKLLAARLLGALLSLFFIGACLVLSRSVRRLMLVRGQESINSSPPRRSTYGRLRLPSC